MKESYRDEMKTQVEFQTEYPEQNSFLLNGGCPESMNTFTPDLKARINVREKICTRVIKQEHQTDYFLTVFEKKSFGTEKRFEKRINVNGKDLNDIKLEFHPQGGYIFFSFMTNNMDNAKVTHSLVFSTTAAYKDPLLLKKDSHFMGFQDKTLYVYKRVFARTRKNGIPEGGD
jgi:hypothetical protein